MSMLKKGFKAITAIIFATCGAEIAQRTYNGAYSRPENGWANNDHPNNLAIITPGINTFGSKYGLKIPFPYSEIVKAQGIKKQDLLDIISARVKKTGTLDEVVLFAHGWSNSFSPGNSQEPSTIYTNDFIDGLVAEQARLGSPITRRLVFLGCDVFTNLTPQWIDYYRSAAKILNAQIVGATNTVVVTEIFSGFNLSGRFAVFFPDGRITRDKLDVPYDPLLLIGNAASQTANLSDEWFETAHQEKPTFDTDKPIATRTEPTPYTLRAAIVNATAVNIRECPEITCRVTARMGKNLKVTLVGTDNNGWQEVMVPDINGHLISGYSASRYLTAAP